MKSVVGVITPVTFQFESAKLKFLHLFWCPKFLLAQLGQKIAAALFSSAAQLSKHGLLQFARPASFCLCWWRTHGMCKSISAWWSFEKVAKYITPAF